MRRPVGPGRTAPDRENKSLSTASSASRRDTEPGCALVDKDKTADCSGARVTGRPRRAIISFADPLSVKSRRVPAASSVRSRTGVRMSRSISRFPSFPLPAISTLGQSGSLRAGSRRLDASDSGRETSRYKGSTATKSGASRRDAFGVSTTISSAPSLA